MQNEIDIPTLLRELKSTARLSNKRISRFTDVTEKSVSDWEKGNALPRGDHLEKLLELARDQGIDADHYQRAPVLWDFAKSYKDNMRVIPPLSATSHLARLEKKFNFLGRQINSPFGASASVLTSTSDRISFLARTGCQVLVYKTVRSSEYPSHPLPNLLFGVAPVKTVELTKGKMPQSVVVSDEPSLFDPPKGLMNRFGMPCPGPEIWQSDFAAAKASMNSGQLLILSVVGTAPSLDSKRKPAIENALIDDFVRVVQLGRDAGAEVFELNLSCPNCAGLEGALCDDLDLVVRICRAVKKAFPDGVYVVKLGYMPVARLQDFVAQTHEFVEGYSGINTMPVEGLRLGQHGLEPAFGVQGLRAGLSGGPIRSYGLNFVKSLDEIRRTNKLSFSILGCGGIISPTDVHEYLKAGADVALATTAFFKNSYFGIEVHQQLRQIYENHQVRLIDHLETGYRNWYGARENLRRLHENRPATRKEMEKGAIACFHEWETQYSAEATMGKRRSSIPTVAEFEELIQRAEVIHVN